MIVVFMIGIPLVLSYYWNYKNKILERKIASKIFITQDTIRETHYIRITNLRSSVDHLTGGWSKALYPTAKRNMITSYIMGSSINLYSMGLF